MHLKSIIERLDDPKLSRVEFVQRVAHIDLIKKVKPTSNNLKMLSFSCGDGIWDMLSAKNNLKIKTIIATDIVDNPVKLDDQKLIKEYADWSFKKLIPDAGLPFGDNEFDIIICKNVIIYFDSELQNFVFETVGHHFIAGALHFYL